MAPVSPSSSGPDRIPPFRMTFQVAARHLPAELLLDVLHAWLGQQRIIIVDYAHSSYTISYINPENTNPLLTLSGTSDTPSFMAMEYFRSRVRSWLQDTKEFSDPSTFYMSHFLMSMKMNSRLQPYLLSSHPLATLLQDPTLSLSTNLPIVDDPNAQCALKRQVSTLHGFEKIKLDFTAEQYFAMFDVAVPPFHYRDSAVTGDNLYRDEYCHGAGLFLAQTEELELHFGGAYKYTNPWYNVQEPAWCETNDAWDYAEARLRPHVCDSGMVIDWILEYAWYGGHLQHIRKISLSGDVQQWVKDKWDDIFKRHAEYVDTHPGEQIPIFAVHKPDPIELETIGMVDEDEQDDSSMNEDDDEAWKPHNHYPPPCKCEIGCWRLRGGKVEQELETKSWEGFGTDSSEVVGDWMDGVELGPVV